MEKLSLTLSPEDWGSLITKYNADSKKVSASSFTEGTVNLDSDVTGSLTKRLGNINYNPTALSAAPKDQFEAIFSDGARHLLVVANGEIRYSSGDNVFNAVVNGTGFSTAANFEFATTQDRVYGGNGVNAPIVYDRNTSYGGVTYTAPRTKTMGAQAPSSAPTAPGAGSAGGAVPAGAHTYKVTFLYYDSEESNGSPASGVCTVVNPNNTVGLTAIPIGGYGVTARKIYRDDNDGLYLHVGTITNNTATTFSDTVAVGATPTEIPEFNNAPPTFALITTWLDKQWLGKVPGDPYTLFYTETSMPDIVRPENALLCNQEDPITAYIVYFGRLIVFNRRSLGQILGTTPDTFRYSAIPGSVGCVDNRTLQIRVIKGVPILIWLSDRGFYSYDGNAINYISDEIEDLVNFNIQQAIQQKNSNTQSSQAQFTSGTASQGIDLASNPGAITTKGYNEGTSVVGTNPRRNFDDQADWEAGLTQTNIVTKDGTNRLKAPTRFAPTLESGQLTTLIIDGGSLKLPVVTNFTGETVPTVGTQIQKIIVTPGNNLKIAYSFIPTRSGTWTNFNGSQQARFSSSSTILGRPMAWADSLSSPGTALYTGTTVNIGFGTGNIPMSNTTSMAISVVAGQRYWFGFEYVSGSNFTITHAVSTTFSSGTIRVFSGGSWQTPVFGANGTVFGSKSYTMCASPISASGQWISGIYDTFSSSISTTLNIAQVGSFPAASFCSGAYTTSGTITVEGSNDPLFLSGVISEVINNLNGNQNLTLSGKRYWRIRISLSTTDDRATPTVSNPILKFAITGTWVSSTIDVSADVTALNSLTISDSQPSGTSIVYAVATSADDITYPDGFVTFGTQTNRRYVRIRAILTTTTDNITTPYISSIILRWTLVSNLISSIIDTAVAPPAGWDTFLASFTANGGTVAFQMRSSASAGTIGAATFFTATPGEFPTAVTPLQFVQWKVIITSSDNDVPFVDSVTVQWLISLVNSIRPASIFTDSQYYVSLAPLNETTNTILLELDSNGKWRRHQGLSISTFSFFFNRPYFGLATAGTIRKFLEGLTDAGTPITFDFRSKAFDYSTQYQNNSTKVKVAGEVILRGINTGATFQLFYSVDLGKTFIAMVTSEGSSSFVSGTDGQNFYKRFRPLWDGSNPISGRTIMYRVYSSDANAVEINGLEAVAFLRNQAPVVTG